jgi:cold shock CspA family protein
MLGGALKAVCVQFHECVPDLLNDEVRKENMTTEIKKVVGRVIKVSKAGWGFISSREIEFTRIFFHWTALRQDTIPFPEFKTGLHVEFVPLKVEGKGWRAVQVRVIDKPVKKEEVVEEEVKDDQVPTLSE